MRCVNCGKDIPFSGNVCPYCHVDNTKSQTAQILGAVFGLGLGGLGYVLAGLWGALVGFGVGGISALVVSGGLKKQVPDVNITNLPSQRPPPQPQFAAGAEAADTVG